jgi:hypothetical protein
VGALSHVTCPILGFHSPVGSAWTTRRMVVLGSPTGGHFEPPVGLLCPGLVDSFSVKFLQPLA